MKIPLDIEQQIAHEQMSQRTLTNVGLSRIFLLFISADGELSFSVSESRVKFELSSW